MFLIILYTGRSYYFPVFLKAFGIGKPLEREQEAVWSARLFVICFVSLIVLLRLMGLDWFVALVYISFVLLMFLVFTRIICETGIPFLQCTWHPSIILSKLFGPAALGAGPLIFIYYLGTILTQDPRECLMPYVATSMKVAENEQVKKLRLMPVLFVTVAFALGVAFISTMWTTYSYGSFTFDNYASVNVPNDCFNKAARQISYLIDTDQLASSNETHGLAKLGRISLNNSTNSLFLSGFFIVILFTMIRFRFSKWPLHPVIFLVWGSYTSICSWSSFLIGWAIKELVVKFGGGKAYQDLKPLFIGLIMGELLAAGLTIVIALIYFLVTGLNPVASRILPT